MPIVRIAIRYATFLGGFVPMLLVFVYVAPQAFGGSQIAIAALWIAGLLGTGWAFCNFVLIVRKDDPIYDPLAGTAVVRI